MRRLSLAAALCGAVASGQTQLLLFDGAVEKPVTTITDLGTIASGDAREVRFHIRNTGAVQAAIQSIPLSGQGFALNPTPLFPIPIAPGNYAEFRVRFTAGIPATYPASLSVGSNQTMLRITVVEGATVSLADEVVGSLLASGSVIDLGRVKRGRSAVRELRVANGNGSALTIPACSVSGGAFRLSGLTCPKVLQSGEAAVVMIGFEPTEARQYQGSFVLDNRTFALSGAGFDPPVPRASITFDTALISGVQRKLVIPLSAASETNAIGSVTMEFRPLETGFPDDSAIRFISSSSRTLPLKVSEGDTAAQFPTGAEVTFQTGATAGTIVFKVKLGSEDEEFQFPVAPAPVSVDTVSLSRRSGVIDIAITAFDNTRTCGRFAFTFYDTAGRVIQPGAIRADWSESFFNYFRSSRLGGSFAMRASFPVSGDPSLIGSIELELTNSNGTARSSRIPAH